MAISDGFQADVDELGSLSRKLLQSAESMGRASRSLQQASVNGLGNADIDESASDFRDLWDYGIGQIIKTQVALHEGLEATAQAYHETDTAIQEALSKGQRAEASGGGKGGAKSPFG
ncbi:hypothetical protein [Streptomyces noursei]|uniref:hypothetical protein n=1 Tax=Streptomyces noursei TaxID=1971 RepID=UPI0030F2BD8A